MGDLKAIIVPDSLTFSFSVLDYDYRDQITEKLEQVTPTVSVKTYGSLGK